MPDTYEAHGMVGTVFEWDGRWARLMTEAGDVLKLHRLHLIAHGFHEQPLGLGDQIHLWASRSDDGGYQIEEITRIVRDREPRIPQLPPEPPEPIAPEDVEHAGTIRTYDETKGFGFITSDDGTDVAVIVTALRASGFKGPLRPGDAIRFCKIEKKPGRWQAWRILTIRPTSAD